MQTGADSALVVRIDGAFIATAGDTDKIEEIGTLAALMYGAAETVSASLRTSMSYIHQHGTGKDMLILRIDAQNGLVIAFAEKLGLGGILYRARATAAALAGVLSK